MNLHLLRRYPERLGRIDPSVPGRLEGLAAEERRRLGRPPVIAVVGEQKAGKSSFLNGILGTPLLGSAVREETRVPTFLQQGPMKGVAVFAGNDVDFTPEDQEPRLTEERQSLQSRLENERRSWETARERAVTQLAEAEAALLAVPMPAFLRYEGIFWRFLVVCIGWWWAGVRRMYQRRLEERGAADTSLIQTDTSFRRRIDTLQGELATAERAIHAWRRERVSLFQKAIAVYSLETEVKHLRVEWPSPRLGDWIWLDTPGMNSTDPQRQLRAWEAIRAEADACLLLSDLRQAASQSTLQFAARLREEIPSLALALSHWDQAENEADDGAEVEEAAARARRRFRRELGMAELCCLSLSSQRPETLDTALQMLKDWLEKENPQEQRWQVLLQRGMEEVPEVVAQAVEAWRQEMQERPSLPPMETMEGAIAVAVQELIAEVGQGLEEATLRMQADLQAELLQLPDRAAVLAWAEAFPPRLEGAFRNLLEAATESAWQKRPSLLAWFQEQQAQRAAEVYGFCLLPSSSSEPPPTVPSVDAHLPVRQPIPEVQILSGQLALSGMRAAGLGASAGAILGTAVLPGLGTLLGGAAGAVAGWFRGADSLKGEVAEAQKSEIQRRLPELQDTLRQRLTGMTATVQCDFRRWSEPYRCVIETLRAEETEARRREEREIVALENVFGDTSEGRG